MGSRKRNSAEKIKEAKELMERATKENINAYVHGPLAFDNAVSPDAAAIKNI